ncbi:MAG TPA: YkgJ family cysteine cluster protein [Spirochaetota bacterium]|nr:YkgJ family cysteine cluster protein [Spirochaetota bacterium]
MEKLTKRGYRIHSNRMLSLIHYTALVRRVDAFCAEVLREYRSSMACAPGCDSCCILETVNAVEAGVLLNHAASIGPAHRDAVMLRAAEPARAGQPCVFLENGLCAVYEARPLICRTHGLPVYLDGAVDFCPKNFTEVSRIESPFILGLENLNTMLGAINLEFQREHPDSFFQKERFVLRELFKSPVADIPAKKSTLE